MNSSQSSNVALHKDHISNHFCTMRCISWSAIVLGALAAISFSFLLNLLALAIGLTAFPSSDTGQAAFATSGFIGLCVLAILSMFPAGWIAGFLGRGFCVRRKIGELYGLGAWALSLVLTIILAAHVGQFLVQSSYLVNRAANTNVKLSNVVATTADTLERNTGTQDTTNTRQENAQQTGIATFISFFVFFIGFLSCCLGGRFGMMYQRRYMSNDPHCMHCVPNGR